MCGVCELCVCVSVCVPGVCLELRGASAVHTKGSAGRPMCIEGKGGGAGRLVGFCCHASSGFWGCLLIGSRRVAFFGVMYLPALGFVMHPSVQQQFCFTFSSNVWVQHQPASAPSYVSPELFVSGRWRITPMSSRATMYIDWLVL